MDIECRNGNSWMDCLADHHIYEPLKDISKEAHWSLSSCKPDGFGAIELLDDSPEKFWQSDAPLPHSVLIEFRKETEIHSLWLYCYYKKDESYTPQSINVYVGNSAMDMEEVVSTRLHEPNDWKMIDLRENISFDRKITTRKMVIKVEVVNNHQNGRDSHIRHIRIAGPVHPRIQMSNRISHANGMIDIHDNVADLDMKYRKYMTLR